MKKYIFFIPFLFIIITIGCAFDNVPELPQSEIILLTNGEYYSSLYKKISSAKKEIHIIMYAVKYDEYDTNDTANDILNLLSRKCKEGIKIKILVDNITRDSYPATIYFLTNNGIEVKTDSDDKTTHTKMVIIDKYIVFIGSHNWTESALSYNNEASVMICNKDIVDESEKYFESLWNEY